MQKKKAILPDGRYLIYYSFEAAGKRRGRGKPDRQRKGAGKL